MMARRTSTALLAALALLAGCGSTGDKPRGVGPFWKPSGKAARVPAIDPDLPLLPAAGSGRGGYYKDDGPGDNPPPNLKEVADAVVRAEPYSKWANRPYKVLGKTYVPIVNEAPFTERGISTWYGKKFHGQRTSSGEIYDMYKMTAAHPTLPIPSYARVTNISNGKQVVVRINDRGPFHAGRVIDVSFTAALKLGLLSKGSHEVMVERLLPNRQINIAEERRNAPQEALPVVAALRVEDRLAAESGAVVAGPAPASAPAAGFYLQLGAYSRAEKAEQVRNRLVDDGTVRGVLEVVPAGSLHRLVSGPFASKDEALQASRELKAKGVASIVLRR